MLPSDAGVEPTSRPPRKPLQAGNGARHISSKGARSGASWPRASLAARGATHSPTSAPFASQEVPSREHSAVGVPAAAAPQPNAAAAQGCGPRDAAVHRSPSAPQVAASSPGAQAKAAEVARSDAVTMESRAQRAAWSRMPRAAGAKRSQPPGRGHSSALEGRAGLWCQTASPGRTNGQAVRYSSGPRLQLKPGSGPTGLRAPARRRRRPPGPRKRRAAQPWL
jgi:hypothetical protein